MQKIDAQDTPDFQSLSAPMAIFDFDNLDGCHAPDSTKWNTYTQDVLPMWIATMDFPSPVQIVESLKARAARPSYGYGYVSSQLLSLVQERLAMRHQLAVSTQDIITLPGLVSGLAVIGRMAAEQGAKIIVPTPCYPPFTRAPENMGAHTIRCPMFKDTMGSFRMQTSLFDQAATEGAKFLLLCNPHNPTGRVFSQAELVEIGEWATHRGVIIVSDEIHCDLVLDTSLTHQSIAALKDFAAHTITLISPSKTFNIAGIGIAFAVIQENELRRRFRAACDDIVPSPNIFALAACQSAYSECEPWRQALIEYLRQNRELVHTALAPYTRILEYSKPQATYLAWMDLAQSNLGNPFGEILERARVALGNGAEFHAPQSVRLNFGCPRMILQEGLGRIVTFLESIAADTH